MYLCVFLYTEMFPSFLQPGIEREFKALQSWTFDCSSEINSSWLLPKTGLHQKLVSLQE